MISELYEETAQNNFADMFDYAINDCGIGINEFEKMFISSEVAKRLDEDDALFLAGHSGIEWANLFIPENKQTNPTFNNYKRSTEFWAGWALAYFWLHSFYTLEEISKEVSFSEIRDMYFPYHEMDITKFYDDMMYLCNNNKLKKYRKKAKLSQHELSLISSIPLKTIQKYESNERSIAKAQVDTIIKLAKALNCSVEDLVI